MRPLLTLSLPYLLCFLSLLFLAIGFAALKQLIFGHVYMFNSQAIMNYFTYFMQVVM